VWNRTLRIASPTKQRFVDLNIYYYVSGHGFGHISRTSVILKKLVNQPAISKIHLISMRSDFIEWEHPKIIKRKVNEDVGVYQKDSLSLDLLKTKLALQEFEKNKNSLLDLEARYCKQHNISLILTDVGSFPIILAVEVGIPSVLIGNFTWDFVYENYVKDDSYFQIITDLIRTEYSFATEALFLPFTCPMPSFLESTRVGMVGRKPNLTKSDARAFFEFSEEFTYILLSFGAYGLTDFQMNWNRLPDHIKLVASGVPGIDTRRVFTPKPGDYPNLVRACDFVLTKPGYGILAETFYAKTPVLYTDRGDFAEYPILVHSLQTYFPSAYVSHSQISECDFEDGISYIRNNENSQKLLDIEHDGEDTIIKHILEYI